MDSDLIRHHIDQFKEYLRMVKRWNFLFLFGLLMMSIFISIVSLGSAVNTANHVFGIFEDGTTSTLYFSLHSWINVVRWAIGLLTIVGMVIWFWVAHAVWRGVAFFVDVASSFVFPEDRTFGRAKRRFTKVINRSLQRFVFWISVSIVFLILISYVLFGVLENSTDYAINAFVWTIVMIVPVVWGLLWWRYLRIRTNLKSKTQAAWDNYYLSRQAIFEELRGSLQVAVMFAILGLLLFPSYAKMITELSKTGANIVQTHTDYESSWATLVASGYPDNFGLEDSNIDLPAPQDLEGHLDWLDIAANKADVDKLIEKFQKGMFVVVVVITGVGIGLPTVVSVIVLPSRRRLIRSALTTAVVSTLVLSGLALFFQIAFFQNSGAPIGLSLVIAVIVGFGITLRQIR